MRTRILTLLLIVATAFAACNKAPEHVNYIPKDAAVVVGLNTNELGKKIAWDALWGNKILDELKKGGVDTGLFKDMAQSGIKGMSTYYVYLKTDKRFDGGNKLTAILPLESASKWEAYLKKLLPETVVKQQKDRKEAFIGKNVYAGWTDKVLMVMNVMYQPMQEDPYNHLDAESMQGMDSSLMAMTGERKVDEPAMIAEMDKAFANPKDNSITTIKHFNELESKGHDITVWVNYDVLMNEYVTADMTGGLSLSNTMWKDAAMAGGIDFEKGRIKANVQYYAAEDLKNILKEFGDQSADNDMIERMPSTALDLLLAWHLSPKAMKQMLDKTNVTGLANAALADKNINTDYILDAFSGDMVAALNSFSMKAYTISADSLFPGQQEMHTTNSDIDYLYAIKIGKKENFDRLLQLAVSEKLLTMQSPGHYTIGVSASPAFITVTDKELVASNKLENAEGYLNGSFKNQQRAPGAQSVKGYPFGLFFDVQAMLANVDPAVAADPDQTNKLLQSKGLLSNVTFNGGKYNGEAFEYNLYVNFMDKENNALLILMDYASRMARPADQQQVAYR